jgi:hypothetical protein
MSSYKKKAYAPPIETEPTVKTTKKKMGKLKLILRRGEVNPPHQNKKRRKNLNPPQTKTNKTPTPRTKAPASTNILHLLRCERVIQGKDHTHKEIERIKIQDMV